MATNTLGEFSDGEDDFVMEIDESLWNNCEDDELIRNINEEEVLAGLYGNDDDENEVLAEVTQTGRGEKRKSDDEQPLPVESGEYYYNIETVKNIILKNSV